MKAERGVSIDNPNESWLESKGTWFTYVLLITIGHLVILSVPIFDTPTAWTLTNIFHNLVSFQNLFFELLQSLEDVGHIKLVTVSFVTIFPRNYMRPIQGNFPVLKK